ncbi:class I SAM-dependent methyltransferase [Marinococcus halophilus]|nr:class I SAM-dependent methyltransferase [Marinococcus halophilus]
MKPTNGMLLEHMARYYFAMPYARGRLLDIACGVGYGAQMTAKGKKREVGHVLGVDIDAEAITFAQKHYYHPQLSFQTGDALDENLPARIGTFDTIVSFETIEHVPDDHTFMKRMYALLRPGGTLVVSTPFGRGRDRPSNSPFHYHQLTLEEWKELLTDKAWPWQELQLYYQQGVAFERSARPGVHYPFGVAVCIKPEK